MAVRAKRKVKKTKVNMNTLARTITKIEGGKVNLPIGQVKEVMGITIRALKALSVEELASVFKKY